MGFFLLLLLLFFGGMSCHCLYSLSVSFSWQCENVYLGAFFSMWFIFGIKFEIFSIILVIALITFICK